MICLAKANSHSQEGSRYRGAAVSAPVLCLRQFQKLVVELRHFTALFVRFESIHSWAIESPERVDDLCGAFVRRDEVVRVLDHGYFLFGHSCLTKTLDDVSIHTPSHWTDEAFWRWRHKR